MILLSFREEIAGQVMKTFQVACDPWGVSVERVEASLSFFSFKNSPFFSFITTRHFNPIYADDDESAKKT
jgi:hypothetical protein